METTIDVLHNRNAIAFGYDPKLILEHYEESKRLDAKRKQLSAEELKKQKKKLADDLHNRLTEIGEKRQLQLYESRVAIVGSDVLAQMVASCVVGLGVKNVSLIDNQRSKRGVKYDFLVPKTWLGQEKVKHIRVALKELNPKADVQAKYAMFDEGWIYRASPQIIFDATNDLLVKEKVAQYIKQYSIPMISVSSGSQLAALSCYWPRNGARKFVEETPNLESLLHRDFANQEQGVSTSGVIAGLAAEEFRKFKFKYSKDGSDDNLASNERLIYNAYSRTLHGFKTDLNDNMGFYRNKRALVAGAGALGNFVALELALMGFGRIDVVDKDTAEPSNYSRQILLRGRANLDGKTLDDEFEIERMDGKKKAEIVAGKLKEIDPLIEASWIFGKFGEIDAEKERQMLEQLRQINIKKYGIDKPISKYVEQFQLKGRERACKIQLVAYEELINGRYHIIFGCFDNKYARLWLNNFAVKNKIPYIDGGTNARGGQVAAYIPGVTKCVDCQLDLMGFGPGHLSCGDRHDGSTIIPNIIVASQMIAYTPFILHPHLNEKPISGVFQFAPFEPCRFYVNPFRGTINQHEC